MERYMDRASEHPHRAPDMCGFLILGSAMVGIYQLSGQGIDQVKTLRYKGYVDLFDDLVIRKLARISRTYWNN